MGRFDMNPYDVLGIRQNASREEIELAFKGRRSQYHPDRYSQSGEEAVDWATRKMQEVNEAYEILNDPVRRSEYEDGLDEDYDLHEDEDEEGAFDDFYANKKTLSQYLSNYDWLHVDNVYVGPRIPIKKVAGAIDSYAGHVSPGEVVILVDDTIFGGAGEGLIATEDFMVAKTKFQGIFFWRWDEVKDISWQEKKILVNDRFFFEGVIVDQGVISLVAARLRSYVRASNPFDSVFDRVMNCFLESFRKTNAPGKILGAISMVVRNRQEIFESIVERSLYVSKTFEDAERLAFFNAQIIVGAAFLCAVRVCEISGVASTVLLGSIGEHLKKSTNIFFKETVSDEDVNVLLAACALASESKENFYGVAEKANVERNDATMLLVDFKKAVLRLRHDFS